jgi:LytS/YehU family sensor histidine kinase
MPKEEGGTVQINIHSIGEQFFCEVLDDGVGRDAALKNRSKQHSTAKSSGVSITKRRLELLHEESSTDFLFEIEDRIDDKGKIVGTRVYFSIPVIE